MRLGNRQVRGDLATGLGIGIMKKCPSCLEYEENDATRFCKHCGTELFFEERFEEMNGDNREQGNPARLKKVFSILSLTGVSCRKELKQ